MVIDSIQCNQTKKAIGYNPGKAYPMIDFKKLIQAGVHFGHKTSRWNPRMSPFIWGFKNNIHLIDVSKTAYQLEKAAQFLESVAASGATVLWVGTKKVAQNIVANSAQNATSPYVTHRWIGGTLTNYPQVKKSLTKLLHYEDIIAKSEQFPYTKKELVSIQKNIERLHKNVGSIRNLTLPVGAVVLVDVKKEQTALREAKAQGIPVVALVDTNSDPSLVDYVIPSNDDAPKAIQVILDYLADAVKKGLAQATEKKSHKVDIEAQKAGVELPSPAVPLTDEEETEAIRVKKAKEAAKTKKRTAEALEVETSEDKTKIKKPSKKQEN